MGTTKKACSALYGGMLAAGLVLIGALPAVGAYAQADGTDGQPQPAVADDSTSVVDSTSAGAPTLQCSVIALRVMAPEVGGARFVCHVDGAQPGDTAFTARATADAQVAGRASACTGQLVGGVGDCVGGLVDRASSTLGQLSFTATLEPSGSTLGPVALPPAPAIPPAQPRPLLPTSPTAPINYFPLPEP